VRTCDSIIPDRDEFLARRPYASENLSFVGWATQWLLNTESQSLALITGLLGFAFFGALAASFIRQFARTEGNELPSSGWIVPALIRGVAAATLVFLAVEGGIVPLLTQNTYAIFLRVSLPLYSASPYGNGRGAVWKRR
jgi:hypothetical protein